MLHAFLGLEINFIIKHTKREKETEIFRSSVGGSAIVENNISLHCIFRCIYFTLVGDAEKQQKKHAVVNHRRNQKITQPL